ncbi:hypothetical protein [Phenylobacterium sp.]|uniref:hypothetical protein n=1 Tax=Phenylobacterium sp. TaxID=1871053 RepID=UPI00271AA8F0|nr:hypothetical protein [Phenylobacterium sp.]MDO8799101.1 hypothetical protein [Phenylobacterium sp.]
MSSISGASLALADRTHVMAAMAQFSGKPTAQWLDPTKPGHDGALPKHWPAFQALEPAQVIRVLAASAPNHCMDGWSYVSRSLSALLAGDPHAARHLAYYAQLRAALSLLANLGIGVVDGINFVVDASGAIIPLDPRADGTPPPKRGDGTHTVVWDALEAWGATPALAASFLRLVRIQGTSLDDILSGIWPGYAPQAVASGLITSWGADLKQGRDDKLSRNRSSYYPTALNNLPNAPGDHIDFVDNFWELFRPVGASQFDRVDAYLIRRLLQSLHHLAYDNSDYLSGQIGKEYERLPAQIQVIVPRSFLAVPEANDRPLIISLASRPGPQAGPTDMLSRALLLLRLATAFTHSNMVDAGLSVAEGALRPWLNEIAVARGFWAPDAPLDFLGDLWLDVEYELVDFMDLKIDVGSEGWLSRAAKRMPIVSEAERIGLWSLTA